MKRVVLFLLLCLSLTAPIYAQGYDPQPLDVTSTFDYFEISYPEGWTITPPNPEDNFGTYTLANDPDLKLDREGPTFPFIESDQIMITVSISPMETDKQEIFEGRTFDYYLGFVNGLQIALNENQLYWLDAVTLSDRMIAGFPGRSVLLQSNFNTIEEIVYFDEKYIIFVSVWTAPGERNNPTIDVILDSIKLVNIGQRIGRLKQTFEGDLSGISLVEGTPVVIANEIEAQEISRDGITSNIWYQVEEICGTQSALMWSGSIQLENDATSETTYLDYCVEYVHDPELSQEIIDEIKAGFESAYLYAQQFAVRIYLPLTVEIYESRESPVFCGIQEDDKLTFYYDEETCPTKFMRSFATHEFFHSIQYTLLGESNPNQTDSTSPLIYRIDGPAWLNEGMASYLTYRTHDIPVPDYQNSLDQLAQMESQVNLITLPDAYNIAAYAVSLLVDGSDELLFDYYTSLGEHHLQQHLQQEDWKTHFEDTFGISVEDFYAQFE